MSRLLARAGARWHLRHRGQLALAMLGIALGVAVVVAVDVAIGSARRAFELSAEAVSGRATHEVVGGPSGLPDVLYLELRRTLALHGDDGIAPVIDRYVELPDHGRVLRVLGVDPFAEAPFRAYVGPAAGQLDVSALLTSRSMVLMAGTAAELGLSVGDTLRVRAGGAPVEVRVAGVLEGGDEPARRAVRDVALADISTAQEIAGAAGVLDRIELRLTDSAPVAALRAALPDGARLLETEVRTGATARLTRAFDTNLTALALVALVFGMFLIYNSVTFSVVQRRPLLGLLRAQGVTSRELFVLILLEAAALGVAASALGLVAGFLLGGELVRLVARTINDLYFTLQVTAVQLGALDAAKALALGTGATIAAAVPPAREAVRAQPRSSLARSVLERRTARNAPRWFAAGAAVALLSAALLLLPTRSLVLGFAALFVLILAAALMTPGVTLGVMRVVRPVAAAAGPVARLAARGVSASLSRTAPAIAALSVAVAVGIAVTAMIGSFRGGVIRWLEQSLQADVYVSAPGLGADRTDVVLDPGFVAAAAALPGVRGISTYRHASLLLEDGFVRVIAADLYEPHRAAFELLDGAPADAWAAFAAGGLLVSEPFAYRRGLRAGDTVLLPTDRGERTFTVAGVYRDYASEHGIIFIDRAAWLSSWNDDAVTSLGVFVAGDADIDGLIAALRSLPGGTGIAARPNRALRESTLLVFDRTFVITGVLRLLALIVAFVGVAGALMALQLERAREVGILRATGLTPAQVWRLVTGQTAFMGLAAVLLAIPLGIAMAWAMVHAINRRAFGWTFDLVLTPQPFLEAVAVGVGAALLAGIGPAWRMSRMRPAIALREDG